MARNFLTPINLNKNELQNAVIQNLASNPSSPLKGQLYFSTSTNKPVWYNGSGWTTPYVGSDATTTSTADKLVLRDSSGNIYGANISASAYLIGNDLQVSNSALFYGSASVSGLLSTGNTILAGYGVEAGNSIYSGSGYIGAWNGDGTSNKTGSVSLYPNYVYSSNPYVYTTLYGGTSGVVITHADALSSLTGSVASDLSLNSHKITNLTDPTNPQDAATKNYVDNAVVGIDWKTSVKYSTTAALGTSGNLVGGTITTTYANGTSGVGANLTIATSSNWTAVTIDGQSLTVGDRVLIKDQATTLQNGLYTVTQVGAVGNTTSFKFTRATDSDTASELTAGHAVFVEQGTNNADSGWVTTTDGAVTVGTTGIVYTQFTGLGSVTAGAGLTKTGNTLDVVGTSNRITVNADSVDIASTYVGQTSITTLGTITTGTWTGTTIAIANGGTGATTAAGARTALGTPGKYTAQNSAITVSGGQATWSIPASTHGLGTIGSLIVQFLEIASGAVMEVDIVIGQNTSTGDVTLTWAAAANVSANTYRVTIIG